MAFSELVFQSDREGSVASTQIDSDEELDGVAHDQAEADDISEIDLGSSVANVSMNSASNDTTSLGQVDARCEIIPTRRVPLAASLSPRRGKQGKHAVGQENDCRVILHIDCNTFFLAVHKLYDESLRTAGPLVLWQYNDVICVSPEAKAAGVRKHMRPTEAQPLVDQIGGLMVHAFTRRWPGPRCWYGPYDKVSRNVFDKIRETLSENIQDAYVLEKASIDEAFIDISGASKGSLEFGACLARSLISALEHSVGIHASVGVARNRLMAKLASTKAKPPLGEGLMVISSANDANFAALLQSTPAAKLPGFGAKESEFSMIGVDNIADLQRHTAEDLRSMLNLPVATAFRLSQICCGVDSTPVQTTLHKKSLSVSSWLTDANLADLALKRLTGLGAESVVIGDGWVFEPHVEKGVTNSTRVRWLLLALILDLDERVVEEFLEFSQLPTKLTVSFQGPGWRKEPGPGSTDGHSRSRTCDFPFSAFATVAAGDTRSAKVSTLSTPRACDQTMKRQPHIHPVYGTSFLSLGSGSCTQGLADGPEILANERYRKRITALVNCVARLISKWVAEEQKYIKIAYLTLTAKTMSYHAAASSGGDLQNKVKRLAQRTLEDVFKNPQKCAKTEACHTPCIDIVDSD